MCSFPSDSHQSDETTLDDIHVKPIVSLPEVEVKSGEEDEEILFKERIKLYCWDCENELWKERGVGDIKILFHPVRKTYRVKMQQDQVLKVCANHIISKNTVPKLMTTSTDAMVWTATDYSEGIRKVEKFAAKFKTPGLAKSFIQVFTDCQSLIVLEKMRSLSLSVCVFWWAEILSHTLLLHFLCIIYLFD
uniref:RanBD1 domain-containing protein n=1 Tax=Cyprinus carpio TaxID=7962 RepID=A0A8C1TGK4_CYPCA